MRFAERVFARLDPTIRGTIDAITVHPDEREVYRVATPDGGRWFQGRYLVPDDSEPVDLQEAA